MRKCLLFCLFLFFSLHAFPQEFKDTITEKKVLEIISFLASDSLKGRGNYTPELYKAADFIVAKFTDCKLTSLPGRASYFRPFTSQSLLKKQRNPDSSGKYDPRYVLQNVIGILTGKTHPSEIIIFSAHYDHLGVGKPDENNDSIFNGANDNASGTTALLMLADYFSKRNDNNRTLIFCAFAGEELGESGSFLFADYLKPGHIKAVINIEMIGHTTIPGKAAVFITGASYSNFSKIFKKNIDKESLKVVDEPPAEEQLFLRSDNYPFALKGIPAHTIMSSDDADECYHKPCDELSRIDIGNMTVIIKEIARGCSSIIAGRDTPSRIDVSNK